MTVIYLAGPMRGLDNFNFPAFDAAAEYLRGFGFVVVSPAEHDRVMGFDETKDTIDEYDLAKAMEWDLQQVRECDFIVLLPGWTTSNGVASELEEAEKWGKGAYEYDKTGRIKFRYGTGNVVLEPHPKEDTPATAVATGTIPITHSSPSAAPVDTIRVFDTGATRDTEQGKLDFSGFLSPWVLESYAQYMHRCRFLPDGTLRSSSNWRKGIPKEAYLSSMARHFLAVWKGSQASEMNEVWADPERDLCALLFNVMGLLHEHLRER
jgi:hypothetical protein